MTTYLHSPLHAHRRGYRRSAAVRLFSLVLGLAALALPGFAASTPVADDAPQRIVSLDLCMDWMLAHHAAPERVASLSPMHRRYPVHWITQPWPHHDSSLEQLVKLQPDLVLAGEYSALLLRERLRTLGYRVEVIPLPSTLDEVETYERQLLTLIGGDPEQATAAPAPASPTANAKRLLLLDANAIGTGRGTFEHQILEQAGWRNYVEDAGLVQLDLEMIVGNPPDAILYAAPEHQALANRFAEHPVLRRAIPDDAWLSTDYWRWQCPGPWTWDLIRQLNQWLD